MPESSMYYGNILGDAADCNTCRVDCLQKMPKYRIAYLRGKKGSLCLLRNFHISKHFKKHQSVLKTTGIKANTSTFVCVFSITSYWYYFYINILNPVDNGSHLSRQTLLMPRPTHYFPQTRT